jgi:hypothetical protein
MHLFITLIKKKELHASIVHALFFGVTTKKSAVRKNQHSDKSDEEICHHQPSFPAATSLFPVTSTFPSTFLAVVVAREMSGLVAVEVAVAGGAVAVAIALLVAVAVAVAVARLVMVAVVAVSVVVSAVMAVGRTVLELAMAMALSVAVLAAMVVGRAVLELVMVMALAVAVAVAVAGQWG